MKKILITGSIIWIIITAIFPNDFNFNPSQFDNYFFVPQNIGTSSPNVSEFIKYGNINMNNCNGLLDTRIVLEEYKDNDFNLVFSINYNSSGFIPSMRPSIIGTNWIPEFGGVVKRTVKGSPDDNKGNYTNDILRYIKDGMYVSIKNGTFKSYSEYELNNGLIEKYSGGVKNPYVNGDFKYDMEPDVFTFKFGNYSGSFIISNNGNPILIEENGCKINLDSLTIQTYSTTDTPVNSVIYITTPDGYKYTFGGNVNYLEYFIPDNPQMCVIRPRFITSWFLKSIESPNKRRVLFTYKSYLQKNKYFNFVSSINSSIRYVNYTSAYNVTKSMSMPIPMGNIKSSNRSDVKMITFEDKVFIPVIDSIKVDNTVISFLYEKSAQGFYNLSDMDDRSMVLKKISTYFNGEKRRITEFNYIEKKAYFFIESLTSNGLKYKFDYYFRNLAPDPLTISIDHWGFWTGGYAVDTDDVGAYCSNLLSNNEVNTTVCDNFLLKKVIYPTGGFSEIKYEHNRYKYYFDRDINTIKYNMFESDSVIACGGARLLSLTNYDNITSTFNTKEFIYKENIDDINETGIIGIRPKYSTEEVRESYSSGTENSYNSGDFIVYTYNSRTFYNQYNHSSNSLSNYNQKEYHISYPNIIEFNSDSSYIKYNYTSLLDIPNIYEQNFIINIPSQTNGEIWAPYSNLTNAQLAEKHNLYTTNEMTSFRGKLKCKKIYSAKSSNPIYVESYEYNINEALNNYNISVISSSMGHAAYKIYLTPCNLIHKMIINDAGMVTDEYMKYNSHNFIKSMITVINNNTKYEKTIKYATEYNLNYYQGQPHPFQKMRMQNMLNYPVEYKTYVNNKLVNAILTTYMSSISNTTGQILPNATFNLHTNIPLSDFVTLSSGDGNTAYTIDPRMNKDISYIYYSDGNLKESYSHKTNIYTTYLWSYQGQYPVAEVQNVTWNQVQGALGEEFLSSLSVAVEPSVNDLIKLSTIKTHFPSAIVTTYTYKPLVGMTSKTDSRGVATYYEYDSFGRLKATYIGEKDENGNETKKLVTGTYRYHYKE